MNQQCVSLNETIWQRLVESNRAHSLAFREFLADGVDRIPLLRQALRAGGIEKMTALDVVPYLTISERLQLYGDLVFLASFAHGTIQAVRHLILSLPREWVLQTLEQQAEPLLRDGTYDEYRRFLELYELLDRELTLRLARRAAAHADPDIREAGEDFLEKLMPSQRDAERP